MPVLLTSMYHKTVPNHLYVPDLLPLLRREEAALKQVAAMHTMLELPC